jgi:hypothetical protein
MNAQRRIWFVQGQLTGMLAESPTIESNVERIPRFDPD